MNNLKKAEAWAVRYLMASGLSYRSASNESKKSFLAVMRLAAASQNEKNRAIARRFVSV